MRIKEKSQEDGKRKKYGSQQPAARPRRHSNNKKNYKRLIVWD
jgi:hypothetical protein